MIIIPLPAGCRSSSAWRDEPRRVPGKGGKCQRAASPRGRDLRREEGRRRGAAEQHTLPRAPGEPPGLSASCGKNGKTLKRREQGGKTDGMWKRTAWMRAGKKVRDDPGFEPEKFRRKMQY